MRTIRYTLLALVVLAAFALSVVLVIRSLSNIPAGTAQDVASPVSEAPAAVAQPTEATPAETGTPPAEEAEATPPAESEPTPAAAETPAEPPAASASSEPSESPFGPRNLPAIGTLLLDRPEILTLGPPTAAGPQPRRTAAASQPDTPAPQQTLAAGTPPPAGTRLTLTAQQSERVRYVLLSHNIMQVEASDLPLRVGGVVPPNVPLLPFPIEMADVVPAYAQYSYVMAQNQIAIVSNASRRIDVVIPIEPR
ncbi:MAG: hypothetical protein IT539_04965 [Bradyrhizobiaceae bacterium]|nr:hypothetical protein [Bradyrhizobiaceae bacterium]